MIADSKSFLIRIDTSAFCRSVDLSRSGIFVVCQEIIAKGRRVDLIIGCEDLKITIATSGLVVHVLHGVGIGLKFSHQNPRTRAMIGELITKLKIKSA